ncbi:MAG: MmcQ-like protein [Bacteroidetes bacterium GWC2_33_15]|nr:MAG: MmcQ-like protein [Bacteroidetes bacterium GWA2_33_15]OFX50765.1 MAG: MmcQ-like protein [Bacteroidetes bacterium GWC2_33_15]OFX62953.1 MAG: MmcQ-like protein [Bacteroidetes bacterium GWB2_32_14]OFX70022.1 MAG: MmcQ-like protein [Bacteroidetes bacterium GWD2_33_33]HAN19021.1 MmcQ-like protein [Bacteroidales bacterium]
MNIEEFREYCISKPGVTEEFPFDETTLVFKVEGKMFALTDLEDEFTINIKCDPEKAIELREQYPESVLPGYHMSKKHWNTILIDGRIPDSYLYHWVNDSYNLVVSKLPKAVKEKYYKKSLK